MSRKTEIIFAPKRISTREHCLDRIETLLKYSGNPVLKPDRPWEGQYVAWPCVIYSKTEKLYRMWYMAGGVKEKEVSTVLENIIDNSERTTEKFYICYAFSKDGIEWEKPSLNIIKSDIYPDNNIVYADAGFFIGCATIFEDEKDIDYLKRYKMLIYDNDGNGRDGIRTLTSPDGINWVFAGEFPVLPSQDTTCLWYDPVNAQYIAFLKDRNDNRRARMVSVSKDFINWSEPDISLAPDLGDAATMNFYGQSAFYQCGQYMGFLSIYEQSTQKAYLELIIGSRGTDWMRLPSRPVVLGCGDSGSWDNSGIYCGLQEPILFDNEKCLYYYTGTSSRHDEIDGKAGIGIAEFQYGRLMGQQFEGDGWFCSIPFRCPGGKLYLDANSKKPLYVEITGCGYGGALKGFGKSDSLSASGNSNMLSVTWNGSDNLDELKGRFIRLKVYGNDSIVYGAKFI